MLWGATAMPGAATADTVAAFGPALRYMRDFGRDGPDDDALPELPPHGAGKWLAKPRGCLLHVSWKDDVEELTGWLDGLAEDIWLTVWHEPHGDVAPAVYRATGERAAQIIAAHPNGHHVVRLGPAVTRYWLAQKRGNPLDWWFAGANTYFIDVYADGPDDRVGYRPGAQLIGEALAPIRAALPGVDIGLSEYGLRLIGDDTGPGRAAAMVEHAGYLRAQPDVVGVTWWDIGGCRITGREPEQSTWRQILEEATPVAWYLNPALTTMRAEVNARYPNRDRDSDGTIGDEAHQGTSSDHNPDGDGSVDAWDMDVEVNGRGKAYATDVEWLKGRFERHPSARYWIHDRTIASRSDGWRRRPYTGANPHDKHVHWNTREAYEDSTAPWGIREQEDDVGTVEGYTPAGATALKRLIRDALHEASLGNSGPTAAVALQSGYARAGAALEKLDAVLAAVAGVDEEVLAKLGSAEQTPEQAAALLRPVLGDRAEAVGRVLAGLTAE